MKTDFHHAAIWWSLDQLAEANGLKPSGLAKSVGLDPTAFNPSKRISREGKLRWPGMETLIKVLNKYDETGEKFSALLKAYALTRKGPV